MVKKVAKKKVAKKKVTKKKAVTGKALSPRMIKVAKCTVCPYHDPKNSRKFICRQNKLRGQELNIGKTFPKSCPLEQI